MAEILQLYSSSIFNKLPDLPLARESFVSKNAGDLMENVLKSIIQKYQLESEFGVGLLHRRFELEESEKLVEFNNISLPWKVTSYEYNGGKVLPSAWAISEGILIPCEFYYSPLGRDSPFDLTKCEAFVRHFIQAIIDSDLEQTLSLRIFPGEGFTGALEVTEGRANINLLPDQVPEGGWDNSIETMWFFDQK